MTTQGGASSTNLPVDVFGDLQVFCHERQGGVAARVAFLPPQDCLDLVGASSLTRSCRSQPLRAPQAAVRGRVAP